MLIEHSDVCWSAIQFIQSSCNLPLYPSMWECQSVVLGDNYLTTRQLLYDNLVINQFTKYQAIKYQNSLPKLILRTALHQFSLQQSVATVTMVKNY